MHEGDSDAKCPRLMSCLEDMLASNNAEDFHYLAVYEEIFDRFEDQLSAETINAVVKTTFSLNLTLLQKCVTKSATLKI